VNKLAAYAMQISDDAGLRIRGELDNTDSLALILSFQQNCGKLG
jgi:hypothetical protein